MKNKKEKAIHGRMGDVYFEIEPVEGDPLIISHRRKDETPKYSEKQLKDALVYSAKELGFSEEDIHLFLRDRLST